MFIDTSILSGFSEFTVGFSGGRDSVALLHWLHSHGYGVKAIHINHNINPMSGSWASFCKSFCNSHEIPITIVDGSIDGFGNNVENAARELRHKTFSVVETPIILAHHSKDQIETVLFKMFRGAGVEGLRGMQTKQELYGKIILRPMLETSRDEINNYVSENGLGWVEDPSNSDLSYDRNYLRNKIIPTILDRFPQFRHNLSRVLDSLSESNDLNNDLAKIDFDMVANDSAWDLRLLNTLSDIRLKNLVKWYIRSSGSYTYSHTTLNEFIKVVRNCNPNNKSKIVFGDIVMNQKGYKIIFG